MSKLNDKTPEQKTVEASYDIDVATILQALTVVAMNAKRGKVRALAVVATLDEGVIIGEHITQGGDPYQLLGVLADLQARVRDKYLTGKPPPAPLFTPDGGTIG